MIPLTDYFLSAKFRVTGVASSSSRVGIGTQLLSLQAVILAEEDPYFTLPSLGKGLPDAAVMQGLQTQIKKM